MNFFSSAQLFHNDTVISVIRSVKDDISNGIGEPVLNDLKCVSKPDDCSHLIGCIAFRP